MESKADIAYENWKRGLKTPFQCVLCNSEASSVVSITIHLEVSHGLILVEDDSSYYTVSEQLVDSMFCRLCYGTYEVEDFMSHLRSDHGMAPRSYYESFQLWLVPAAECQDDEEDEYELVDPKKVRRALKVISLVFSYIYCLFQATDWGLFRASRKLYVRLQALKQSHEESLQGSDTELARELVVRKFKEMHGLLEDQISKFRQEIIHRGVSARTCL